MTNAKSYMTINILIPMTVGRLGFSGSRLIRFGSEL